MKQLFRHVSKPLRKVYKHQKEKRIALHETVYSNEHNSSVKHSIGELKIKENLTVLILTFKSTPES